MNRKYILERLKNTSVPKSIFGIPVKVVDKLPENIDFEYILYLLENKIPKTFFRKLKSIHIEHLEEFTKRDINALYKDGILFVTNKQDNTDDLLDDIIHELAHHVETVFLEDVYADNEIKDEFLKKRKQLAFELASEGYDIPQGFHNDVKFSQEIDTFLYKRVGYRPLKMFGLGIFVRPYAATSLREYFAVGFEFFYLKNAEELKKTCPSLYNKIYYLHDLA